MFPYARFLPKQNKLKLLQAEETAYLEIKIFSELPR